jgi:hypothetical protein
LNHRQDGRALRVFEGVRGDVRYLGEFRIDEIEPFRRSDSPEYKSDRIREVLVFRLRPLDIAAPLSQSKLDQLALSKISEVSVEEQHTESAFVNPKSQGYEISRREQSLVIAYSAYLATKGCEIVRHQIRPDGESKPLFSDLYDKTRNNLVEAKGPVARESIRMAIGQLADYSRFIQPKPNMAVLLPIRPRKDLEELLLSQRIHAVWQKNQIFEDNSLGSFI